MENALRTNEVVITGIGAITPLGDDLDEVWKRLLASETAARSWQDLAEEGFRTPLAARVTSIAGEDASRGSRMAIAAARRALASSNFRSNKDSGVFIGTTMGESIAFEQAAAGDNADLLNKATATVFPRAVRRVFEGRGPERAYAAACAAGNYAIGAAAEAIASGQIICALAGGVEPFSRIALAGFSRSRAMSGGLCRPFDKQRSGMQLGEAAVLLLLERKEDAEARGVKPLARIMSLGLSCDAYHPTAPSPGGEGMARAMKISLEKAGLRAADINWICAHGSGTRASDDAEAKAIHQVFGNFSPSVSGLKGAFGHSLGAATALEAAVAVLALQHQYLPPTVNFETQDPELAIDVVKEPRETGSCEFILNCGYGFGGLNSALVLQAL